MRNFNSIQYMGTTGWWPDSFPKFKNISCVHKKI